MDRKTAIKAFFALLTSQAVAQELKFESVKMPEEMTYWFNLKRVKIQIDGREVVLTAKELADALGAK